MRDITQVQEKSAKIHFDKIGALLQCTKAEMDFLFCLFKLEYIVQGTNQLLLTPDRKKEMCKCSNIKIATLYNVVYSLIKKEILIKNDKGQILINPLLFTVQN